MYRRFYVSDKTLRSLYTKLLASSLVFLFIFWYLLTIESNKVKKIKMIPSHNYLFNPEELLRFKGDILQRLDIMNSYLSLTRLKIKKEFLSKSKYTKKFNKMDLKIINELDKSFFDILSKVSCSKDSKEIYLEWLLKLDTINTLPIIEPSEFYIEDGFCSNFLKLNCPTINYLISKYYPFFGSPTLCDALKNGEITYTDDNTIISCTSNFHQAIIPTILLSNATIDQIKAANFNGFVNMNPTSIRPLYIFKQGFIDSNKNVHCDDIAFHPSHCKSSVYVETTKNPIIKNYTEVFIISGSNTNTYYAEIIEQSTRLALFIDFLKVNPNILIHVNKISKLVRETVEMLGIKKNRLIDGQVKADILYIPRSSKCELPNLLEIQVMNRYYRRYALEIIISSYFQKRDTILVLTSNKSIFMKQYFNKILSQVADNYGLKIVLHHESKNSGSQKYLLKIFGSALVIISMHTTSLANLIYGQPGTLVLEHFCSLSDVDFRYQRLANILGMLWYGGLSQMQCEKHGDDVSMIITVVKLYLQFLIKTED